MSKKTIDWTNTTYFGLKVLRVWWLPNYTSYAVELDVASNDRWVNPHANAITDRPRFDWSHWALDVQEVIKSNPPIWAVDLNTPEKCTCNLWGGCKCGVFEREMKAKARK